MSRYAAARPKRAGEAFARAHHGEYKDDVGPVANKKVKFDVRNPSALAPSAGDGDDAEEDHVLAADVIASSGRATKRGAVNIDGYDSDSDNETFQARAEAREAQGGGENVRLGDVMDSYTGKQSRPAQDDDEEVDMFADEDDDDAGKGVKPGVSKHGRKNKERLRRKA
ncbi:hypothetical protein P8C59_007238 [Phyllachora maydis]|uniref:Uncharacterized protein n=1 Tax=Phyllachora maydis TaxID=1825666 RepID=A0AAD9MDC4_9PEZI|nr:hypothetical protein P8C59_007238 [Phyllachora maydis]